MIEKQETIKRYITRKIQSGEWEAGEKILSERQFAIKFETTTATIRKVLRKFINSKAIVSKKNKGYFVSGASFLSPKDHMGLNKNDDLNTKLEQINDKDLSIFFLETDFFKSDDANNLSLFKKITKHKSRIIKYSIIGIEKDNFDINYLNASSELKKSFEYDGEFSIRKFLAGTDRLIDKREDLFMRLETVSDFKIPFDSNYVSFLSRTMNKDLKTIEVAITFIESDYVFFQTNTELA